MFFNNIKYCLLFLLFIYGHIAFTQDIPSIQNKPVAPDTINNNLLQNITADSLDEYEIIYEYDTIRQTKVITDYDTIVIIDSLKEKENIKKTDTIKSVTPENKIVSKNPDITKKSKEKYFTAGFYFSPFVFSNQLKTNDSLANLHLNYRKTYEKPLPSFSLALTAGYHINRWSIQSGVQYGSLRNKYNYPFKNEKYVSSVYMQDSTYFGWVNDTIDWYYQIIGNDTNWIPVINQTWGTLHDSIPKTKIDTSFDEQIKNGIQYYHFIEIPLIFGYDFLINKKINLAVNTGILTSFLIYQKGEIVSVTDAKKFVSLSDYPFVRASFSAYLGLGINYSVNKNLNIEIHPYFQKGMSSVLHKNFILSQSLDKKGVSIGLRYKF